MGNLKLRHGCVLGWGVVQLIYSICMLICGVLLLYWHSVAGYYGVGIWGGVWALITGFLGIVGGVTNNKGVEIAFMVFNILGSVFIYVPMVVVSIATSRYENGCEFDGTPPDIDEMLNMNKMLDSAKSVINKRSVRSLLPPALQNILGPVMSLGQTVIGNIPGVGSIEQVLSNSNLDLASASEMVDKLLSSSTDSSSSNGGLGDLDGLLAILKEGKVTPLSCKANAVYLSALNQVKSGSLPADMESALRSIKSTYEIEYKVVNKNGVPTCACVKGYDNMFGTQIALIVFGAFMILSAVFSAAFACCAVCRCCGASDSKKSAGPTVSPIGYGQYNQFGEPHSHASSNSYLGQKQICTTPSTHTQWSQSQQGFPQAPNEKSNFQDLPSVVMH